MKYGIIFFLLLLTAGLQYRLWYGEGSLLEIIRLKTLITEGETINQKLLDRNKLLEKEVQTLKSHPEFLEERARADLGMIKSGETFFLVIEPAR